MKPRHKSDIAIAIAKTKLALEQKKKYTVPHSRDKANLLLDMFAVLDYQTLPKLHQEQTKSREDLVSIRLAAKKATMSLHKFRFAIANDISNLQYAREGISDSIEQVMQSERPIDKKQRSDDRLMEMIQKALTRAEIVSDFIRNH